MSDEYEKIKLGGKTFFLVPEEKLGELWGVDVEIANHTTQELIRSLVGSYKGSKSKKTKLIAKKTALHRHTVNSILNGKTLPHPKTMAKLCKYFQNGFELKLRKILNDKSEHSYMNRFENAMSANRTRRKKARNVR